MIGSTIRGVRSHRDDVRGFDSMPRADSSRNYDRERALRRICIRKSAILSKSIEHTSPKTVRADVDDDNNF